MFTEQKDYLWKYWEVSTHKVIELQLTSWPKSRKFGINFEWRRKRDHGGVLFSIDLWNFYFGVDLYDIRHWDYKKNQYEGEEE